MKSYVMLLIKSLPEKWKGVWNETIRRFFS